MTQCGWYARQTISLSVLARSPNKGLELEISDETGSGGGKEGPREDRGELLQKVYSAKEYKLTVSKQAISYQALH